MGRGKIVFWDKTIFIFFCHDFGQSDKIKIIKGVGTLNSLEKFPKNFGDVRLEGD